MAQDFGKAAEYARTALEFPSYTDSPYRSHDQLGILKDTILVDDVDEYGLIQQKGLPIVQIPSPHITIDEGDDFKGTAIREEISKVMSFPSNFFLRNDLQDLRLPAEVIDLGYRAKKDILDYSRDINAKRSCNISRQWLPFIPVNNEKDEGLTFPSTSARWQFLVNRELEKEKLELSQEANALASEFDSTKRFPESLRFCIQNNSRQASSLHGYHTQFLPNLQQWKNRPEPLTPLMSSISPPGSPCVSEKGVAIIDLTSEQASPVAPQVMQLQIDANDGRVESDVTTCSWISPPPPQEKHPRCFEELTPRSQLKIDVPLVSSSTIPSETDQHFDLSQLPPLLNDVPESCRGDDKERLCDYAIERMLGCTPSRTMQMVEQEQFPTSDSALRLCKPIMDFDIPKPQWSNFLADTATQFVWLKENAPNVFHHPQATDTESSLLNWTIPERRGGYSMEDDAYQPGEKSQPLLVEVPSNMCSASYISEKHEPPIVLRIADEEELRSEETWTDDGKHDSSYSETIPFSGSSNDRKRGILANGISGPSMPSTEKSPRRKAAHGLRNILPETSGTGATSTLLSNFIYLRAPKRIKLGSQTRLNEGPGLGQEEARRSVVSVTNITDQHAAEDHTAIRPRKPPTPLIDLPSEQCFFIVSLDLPRSILRHIESSLPNAKILDRDFSRYGTVARCLGSAKPENVVSTLSFEADMSLSPSIGLIVTTLLKVRQRPLPGSSTQPPLRERVQRVCQRYEVLFVLVSENNPRGEVIGRPSDSDLAAYDDFVRFSVGVEGKVTTYFVPGNDKTLATWVLFLVTRFASHGSSLGHYLNSEDNSWELFLRQMGMNVYGAQVISGMLLEQYGNLGLAHFLTMSTEERLNKFEQTLSGQDVLRRVSSMLCKEWL